MSSSEPLERWQPARFIFAHGTGDLNNSQIEKMRRMVFLRRLPGGICFAHGPYTEMECPKWPACATDPQRDDYRQMGMAQVADNRKYTQAELDAACAQARLEEAALWNQRPSYEETRDHEYHAGFDSRCSYCRERRLAELERLSKGVSK